jgi:hypothetical protein
VPPPWSPSSPLKNQDRVARDGAADALGQIGAPAVEPLVVALKEREWAGRQTAAEALLAIYRLGELDEPRKAKLLACRGLITRSHDDWDAFCGGHTDEGIGVAFPV